MVFAEAHGATVKHYRDDSGTEADAVFQLSDGRYALIEIKAGMNVILAAEANLLKFDQMIARHNEAVLKGSKHPGVPINWDAFNGHYTGYGEKYREQYPYGEWPRWICYSGADIGFAVWTSKRRAEDFYWMLTENACVDLEKARIDHLSLDLNKKVKVTIGPGISKLILNGDPTNLKIKANGGNLRVDFEINQYSHPGKTYSILDIKDLQDTESVCVSVSPLGDPLDCESINSSGI